MLFERMEKPGCVCCNAFAPEVMVPTADDGAAGMCWVCAHIVADHGVSPEHVIANMGTCTCPAELIFPKDVLFQRQRRTNVELDGPELLATLEVRPAAATRPGRPGAVAIGPAASRAVPARHRR